MSRWDSALRGKVLKAVYWSLGAKLAVQLISWAITIIVIRLLQPSDYGLAAMSDVVFQLLMQMSSAGIGAAVVQSKNITELQVRQIFGVLLVVNFVLFAIQFVSAPWIARYYGEPSVMPLIRTMAIGFLLVPFSTIPYSFLARAIDFKRRAMVEIAVSVLGNLLILALAWRGFGVWSLVLGQLAKLAIRSIGLNIAHPWLRMPVFSIRGAESLIGFGGILVLTHLIWFVYTKADVVIAARPLGAAELGFYSVAFYLASLPSSKIMPLLNEVAFPAYARIKELLGQVKSHYLKSLRLVTLITLPLFLGLASVTPEFVTLVLGERWQPATLPLQIFCLVTPLQMMGALAAPVLNGLGKPSVLLGNASIALAIMAPAFFIGVHWAGVFGLCMAWVIAYPVVFLISAYRALPIIGVSVRDFIAAIRPALVSSLLMAGFLALLRHSSIMQGSPWLALLAPIALGGVIYLASMGTLFRANLIEAYELVSKRG